MNGQHSAIHLVAKTAPWLAPLPSAWFVGRSIYYHLLLSWPVAVSDLIHVAVAAIAGLTIEVLAIVSVYNALALHRWNDLGHVRKDTGAWERAPFGLAVLCAGLYLVAAVVLLVVLEAVPQLAQFAPIMFPVMGIVAAVNLGVLDQHASRLHRYGLTWDLTRTEAQADASEPQANRKPAHADAWPTASLADWRGIAANLDGQRATCDADCVYDALREAQLAPPASRTVQAWARRTREGEL